MPQSLRGKRRGRAANQAIEDLQTGVQLIPQAFNDGLTAKLLALAEERYRTLATNRMPIRLPRRFVASASSFGIEELWTPLAAIECFGTVLSPACRTIVLSLLGGPLRCNYDQSWIRRQYAPANCPPCHAPHSWHQDGALGFDFLAFCDKPIPADALLNMVTCWITLTPCGTDAPGLELLTRRQESLLAPAELTEPKIRERFAAEDFWRPVMKPGDALLFGGDILHRTHVAPGMTKDRTSVELRFFPARAILERLKDDRFIEM